MSRALRLRRLFTKWVSWFKLEGESKWIPMCQIWDSIVVSCAEFINCYSIPNFFNYYL